MLSLEWTYAHWFDLLQSLGIVGSLFFSGIALRVDTRVRKVQNLFTLTKQHREIWSELYDRPELARVLDPLVDLDARPITREEELFVRFLILHLKTAFRAIAADFFDRPEGLLKDIRDFFVLPIPLAVWNKVRYIQDRDFERFVDAARHHWNQEAPQ